MSCTTVAENHGLDQGRPAKIVDVIEWGTGRSESLHDGGVPEVRGSDQRGSVVSAGDCAGIAAEFDRQFHHLQIVLDSGNGDDVVAIILERIDIGAPSYERTNGVILRLEGSDVKRRTSGCVARVRIRLARK